MVIGFASEALRACSCKRGGLQLCDTAFLGPWCGLVWVRSPACFWVQCKANYSRTWVVLAAGVATCTHMHSHRIESNHSLAL